MIIFRDTLSHGGTRLPAFLVGCSELQRMQTVHGDVVTAGDPLFLTVPEDAVWHQLGDGWQVACIGDADPLRYLRQRPDIDRLAVVDAQGRQWFVPAVLTADGQIALPLPWGKVDGVRCRRPTAEQQRLLTAANAAREEILGNKLATVPIDIVAEWAHALLGATYHLSGDVIDFLELLDDTLASSALLASSGFPKPQKHQEDQHLVALP